MNIRLLALDLDGTVLRSDNTLAPDVRQALLNAAASGIEVAVASGRPFGSMPREILALPDIRWVIASNGAAIYENGRRVHADTLREADVLRVLKLTRHHDLIWEAFAEGETCTDKRYYDNPTRYGCSAAYVSYVRGSREACEDMRGYIFQNRHRLDSIEFVSTDRQLREALWKQMEESLDSVYITSSSSHFVELMNATATKANALQWLADRLGIDIKNTAAAGNADNDADMLLHAGIGAAVANGTPRCLAAADKILPANDEGGVRVWIEELLRAPLKI
ncbi:MAG: HAD family phosphatase [Ruminococcus sp.]|nr:HAD family phosphatase [Ruminococcus sp.]